MRYFVFVFLFFLLTNCEEIPSSSNNDDPLLYSMFNGVVHNTYGLDPVSNACFNIVDYEIALTDSIGYFCFDSIAPGNYNVIISKETFIPESLSLSIEADDTLTRIFYITPTDTTIHGYTDQDILDIVLSDYRFPEHFYTEELNGGSLYYIKLNNLYEDGPADSGAFELCTSIRDTAFNWHEISNINNSTPRDYVSEKETEKYFEFKRVNPNHSTDMILYRVHKCSYLDRSMYNYWHDRRIYGQFNVRPLTKENVKEVVEYMVFYNNFSNGSAKYLESFCDEYSDKYVHTVFEVQTTYTAYGWPDHITLFDHIYTIDKETGNISKERILLKVFNP